MIDLSCKYIGLQLKNPVVIDSSGLTFFNRPYNPDIDIEHLQINASNMLSTDTEYSHSLRWVALLAGKLKCDIAASTGIHNHETVIKQLLAGADAVHNPASYERVQFLRLFSSIE